MLAVSGVSPDDCYHSEVEARRSYYSLVNAFYAADMTPMHQKKARKHTFDMLKNFINLTCYAIPLAL